MLSSVTSTLIKDFYLNVLNKIKIVMNVNNVI